MKKLYSTAIALVIGIVTYAQVGIGTVAPEADLEIIARTGLTGTEYNGITIPKVAALPSVVPPSGTIIYLDSGTPAAGFYFSDGTAFRNVTDILTASGMGAFYETGTTDVASSTTQNIFRTGRTSIGSDTTSEELHVESSPTGTSARNTVGIANRHVSSTGGDTSSMFSNNRSTTTGTKYGIQNNVTQAGAGARIGIDNTVFDSASTSASATATGIRNIVGFTQGDTTENYGIYNEIGTDVGTGTNYGIYSYSINSGLQPSYSGYFRGSRFAIRSEDDSDGYDLPTTSGTAGQVLTANGVNGEATWTTLPTNNDNDATNEGNLSVVAGGSNDAQIASNTSGSTNVTIAGGEGIDVTENSATGTIAITNTIIEKQIVTLDLWSKAEPGTYGINNSGFMSDRNGIEIFFDPRTISNTGNVQVKLFVNQSSNSNATTNYELDVIDTSGTRLTAVDENDTFYNINGGGGLITTESWTTVNIGTGRIARFILKANNTGSNNAELEYAYIMIRNAD